MTEFTQCVGGILILLALSALSRHIHRAPPLAVESPRQEHPVASPQHPASDKLRDGGRLDLNLATEAELTLLPGIGPALAKRILRGRPFESPEALQQVSGIGAKTFARLQPFIEVSAKK